ncbi:smr (Small MutS Related) domain-containing protein [Melia azedarach]|uniref:Smr (Small MutS Related) domain-containing protein n=1 Tax=Melia azedarach TaxID=155640 RepID=A0ACC1XVU3_MELAZ|nr:smr (Small MutS Related) domain-containing protein [Melia azedarach]
MSSTRVKSPGWAAFDLKQRQKQGLEPEIDKDAYPPIPSTLTTLRNCENMTRKNAISMRPFSSVLVPSVDFPTVAENKDVQTHVRNSDSDPGEKHGNNVVKENKHDLAHKKLKALHPWADDSLIEDIIAAVDNNMEKALNLLSGMVSSSSTTKRNKETKIVESSSTVDDCLQMKTGESFLFEKTLEVSNLSSISEDSVEDNLGKLTDVHVSSGKNLPVNAADMKLIMEHLSTLPIEPEWEEDDVYLVHRKDALKMMRSTSQHYKAANNAFLRGDHFAAQQHSLKAREEWLIAERLNSKAAKEILSIRNNENDIWKLDLHGLHATEAVQALQDHLQKIEMQIPVNRLASSNRYKTKNGAVHYSSCKPSNHLNVEDMEKQQASLRQIQKSLQVITDIVLTRQDLE